jgi:hypothetical protein
VPGVQPAGVQVEALDPGPKSASACGVRTVSMSHRGVQDTVEQSAARCSAVRQATGGYIANGRAAAVCYGRRGISEARGPPAGPGPGPGTPASDGRRNPPVPGPGCQWPDTAPKMGIVRLLVFINYDAQRGNAGGILWRATLSVLVARFQVTVLGGSIRCLMTLMVLDFGRVIYLT